MPPQPRKSSKETPGEVVDRLLAESEALRRRSEALAAEVVKLREALNGNAPGERRKKPRLKGK
jgi:hypothetical protein